jgi:hypothetical protein
MPKPRNSFFTDWSSGSEHEALSCAYHFVAGRVPLSWFLEQAAIEVRLGKFWRYSTLR